MNCAEIGDWFSGVSAIKDVTIGNNVAAIDIDAFAGCNGIERVVISDLAAWCGIDFGSATANPLYYAENLYMNGDLMTDAIIPASVTEIKDFAFYNCKGLASVRINDNVTSIGDEAFYGCSGLEYVTIPDGVKTIGQSAFNGCSSVEELYISSTIESIGDCAFAECNNILDIKIGSKKAITASENIFSSDAYNNACLYVPTGRKFAYEKATPWNNFYIAEMDFTGIDEVFDEVKTENGNVKTVYDLNGRAVENPSNGVYIVNGKKVLVK